MRLPRLAAPLHGRGGGIGMSAEDAAALEEIAARLARLQQQAEAAGLDRLAEIIRAARLEAERARLRRHS
jgi:hypothetical protein